ncbi:MULTISPECIES: HAD family hydrolase [Fusobacterium]|uniref:HAD family hydrolase n=1 Tax=Fusobacterium TaxID=848 RepID=UPI001F2C921B|nr:MULTISPECIES: HAD family hydrolase [Fusobacterium]MCF2611907.1 HAD family hydrolase [Fusobacterium perfoetens]MDY2981133.1 HAD family hydrolase [Fusobacterium sp.]
MIGAFFDIDGTIYRNSLLTEHFKKMIKYELIDPLAYEEKVKETFKLWNERKGDYDKYLLSLTESYVNAMIGISEKDNDFVSDQVLNLSGNRVYRYTRERIKWHKEQGHKVIFISGSPDFLVKRMANKCGADDYQGSIYHTKDGKFSGEISPMWDSRNKIKSLNRFCEKYNLDLEKSYAYGDTSGDYSMLKSVGNPIAINPSKEFLEKLRENQEISKKVQIIIERKDVIYKVNLDVENLY